MEHPRLLRLVQPQHQGHLPAVSRLVRRQPGAPVGLPARAGSGRYVEFMGGADAVLEKARKDPRPGGPAVDRDGGQPCGVRRPGQHCARELLASALERLGHGAENGLWRNIYLRGAEELRGPIAPPPPELTSPEVLGALTIEQLFDSLGVRLDGQRAASATACIDWVFTDLGRTYRTELSNGALIHSDAGYGMGEPGLTITLAKPQLSEVIATGKLDARHVGGRRSWCPPSSGWSTASTISSPSSPRRRRGAASVARPLHGSGYTRA